MSQTTVGSPVDERLALITDAGLAAYGRGSAAYDVLVSGFNLDQSVSPVVVVQPSDAADVATLVRLGNEHGFGVGVRLTGHGLSPDLDDQVMVHTGRLAELHVDAEGRRARIGAGVIWQQVLDAAAARRARRHRRVGPLGRRRRLHHRRRPQPGRADVRAGRRPRPLLRRRDGRRRPADGERDREPRPVLGAQGRARDRGHRHGPRPRPAADRRALRRCRLLRRCGRRDGAAHLEGVVGRPAARGHHLDRLPAAAAAPPPPAAAGGPLHRQRAVRLDRPARGRRRGPRPGARGGHTGARRRRAGCRSPPSAPSTPTRPTRCRSSRTTRCSPRCPTRRSTRSWRRSGRTPGARRSSSSSASSAGPTATGPTPPSPTATPPSPSTPSGWRSPRSGRRRWPTTGPCSCARSRPGAPADGCRTSPARTDAAWYRSVYGEAGRRPAPRGRRAARPAGRARGQPRAAGGDGLTRARRRRPARTGHACRRRCTRMGHLPLRPGRLVWLPERRRRGPAGPACPGPHPTSEQGAPPPCPYAAICATSPSWPTSTTARPPSWTPCCGSPGPSAPTRTSTTGSWTRWTWSARRASPSSRRTRRCCTTRRTVPT